MASFGAFDLESTTIVAAGKMGTDIREDYLRKGQPFGREIGGSPHVSLFAQRRFVFG